MTCRDAQEHLADLFDCEPPEKLVEIESHLAVCEACARRYAAIRTAAGLIQPHFRVQPSPGFKERVMDRITQPQLPAKPSPQPWRWALRLAIGTAAILAVLLLPSGQSPALKLMAQSAEAMSNLQSVHITARMRSAPNENFEAIDANADWSPLEIWKQFGETPKWRVEKPGRVAVMDGSSSLMLIRPDQVVEGGRHTGFLDWLEAFLDTDKLMENELAIARAQRLDARLAEQDGKYVLTVHHVAQGDFRNDWLLNKAVSSSNHTRVYRFDMSSKRLEGMEIVLNTPAGDVPIFEISGVTYNEAFDPRIFALDVPPNAIRAVAPEQMSSARPLPQSPKDAAAMFFDALAQQDAEELAVVYPSTFTPEFKGITSLRVISLGEPFRSGLYAGWYVPYEITINGRAKKLNLAVRNDNSQHRWMMDGGF
jgi:outer membrane lipoprotein-sorting protein